MATLTTTELHNSIILNTCKANIVNHLIDLKCVYTTDHIKECLRYDSEVTLRFIFNKQPKIAIKSLLMEYMFHASSCNAVKCLNVLFQEYESRGYRSRDINRSKILDILAENNFHDTYLKMYSFFTETNFLKMRVVYHLALFTMYDNDIIVKMLNEENYHSRLVSNNIDKLLTIVAQENSIKVLRYIHSKKKKYYYSDYIDLALKHGSHDVVNFLYRLDSKYKKKRKPKMINDLDELDNILS